MPRARGARLLGALDVDAGAAGGGVPSQSVPPARPWRTLFVWCFGVAVVAAIATLLSDSNRQLTPHGPLVHAVTAQLRRDPTLATPASSIASQIDDAVLPPPASSSVLPADAAAATVSALSDVEPAAEGADVLFAAPAPVPAAADNASLLPDVVVEEDTPKPVPAVAFLFLTINGEVVFPEIWADFFAGAEDEERFNVFIHRSTGDSTEVSPAASAFLEACRGRASFVPTAAQTAWGQLIGAERSLTVAALAAPENAAFVFISHTTLPVKPLSHVYETLLARGASSSFCLTTQQAWVRSRAAPGVVFPKHSQWMVLSRGGAERFADAMPYGDPVQAVNAACGGSWRQCYPATSEELVMAAITGGIPAVAMGSDWLASHPPAGGGADAAVVTALRNELAAGVDDGGPAADVAPMPDVNGGGVPVRDVGATNQGVCDTWNWWDDFGSDASLEPAFEPFALLARWAKAQAAQARGVNGDGRRSHDEDTDGVEDVLEQHVDRFWSPPYHPQELQARAMTEAFLLEGLCASKALFARKFAPSFTLREAPLPRGTDGMWQCPAAEGADDARDDDVWKAAPRARIDGLSCDGMRHAPVAQLGARECRAMCCAMGREQCTAWQYRGRWTKFHFCWLGHAGTCSEYPEAQSQLWRGERLLEGPPPPALNATAEARRRVVDTFARCFRKARDETATVDGAAAEAAPDALDSAGDAEAAPEVPPATAEAAAAVGVAPEAQTATAVSATPLTAVEQAQQPLAADAGVTAAEDVLPAAEAGGISEPQAAAAVTAVGAADEALPAPGGERSTANGLPAEVQPAMPEAELAAGTATAAVENGVMPLPEPAISEAEPDAELAAARADAAGVDVLPAATQP